MKKRRWLRWILLVIALVLIGLGIWGRIFLEQEHVEHPDPGVPEVPDLPDPEDIE